MVNERKNPDALLHQVQEEERQERSGKLKIYLGSAPGVGKTYTMLTDAQAEREHGLDVIVGVAESHGRQEIDALLNNFEILPKKTIHYQDKHLLDFDLDGALKRHPGLILMDEMAHTNAPGLRHKKRWQDIKELLDRGIDVYTTLNVQHIESLNDDVAQIIHAPIRETVPDSMLERADTIELVDLPPDELLKRLHEGKVYLPAQAELACELFFRKGNLIALRELALRAVAKHVNTEVLLYRQDQGIKRIWPTMEKLLVCVGNGAEAPKLIRAAKQMAASLQAEWIAVYVDSPRVHTLRDKRNQAIQHLHLAEQLGAQTRVLTGFDTTKEIMGFAQEQNITIIMIWKHIRPWWRDLWSHAFADKIVRSSGEINVYIMTGEHQKPLERKPSPTAHTPWRYYAFSISVVIITTLINVCLYPYFGDTHLIMVYLLGMTIIALFGHIGPAMLGTVVSVLTYDFFFIPPFYSFYVENLGYFFILLVMLIVAQVISQLTILMRRQTEAARLNEQQTSALYTLSRQLSSLRGTDKLLYAGVNYISEMFESEIIALLPKNDQLTIRAKCRTNQTLNAKEQGIAQWVYELGQKAGLGTDSLSFSDALYIPLLGSQRVIGVLRLKPIHKDYLRSPEKMHLLEALAHQIALALEVDRLQEEKKKSEFKIETNRLRSALLQSISHDLRAPLVAIIGAASTQIEMADKLDEKAIKKLGKNIYFEAEQLNRLINNLLQIAYFETNNIHLQKQLLSLNDLIHMIVKTSSKKLGKRPINITISDDLPPVPLDKTLMQEVFINLIDNAVKFTPVKTPIDIQVIQKKNSVMISIRDHGPGIAPDEVNKLFEKYYRGRMLTSERGLGLGLAICRMIVEAHGGKIWAENHKEGGAIFRFTLSMTP